MPENYISEQSVLEEGVYVQEQVTSTSSRQAILDWSLAATIVYSISFFFVTLSFVPFFYFAPDGSSGDIMPLLLVLYLVSWPIAVIVPPLVLARRNQLGGSWTTGLSLFFLVSVLLWPAVTETMKIRAIARNGVASIDYWGTYPIFILLEILWPLACLVLWIVQVKRNSPESLVKREIRARTKEEIRARLAAQGNLRP